MNEAVATEWAGSLDSEIYTQYLDLHILEYDKPFYPITEDDRYVIECIVAGEAKGEPTEGKMAVAQCLLNAMVKDGLSASEARKKYQYSGWDDELQNSNPDCWAEVCEAVSRVFDDGEFVSENPILYFYAPKRVYSRWHESLNHAVTMGGHKFFYLDEDVNADWFLNLKGAD
nr:MAG TPA: Cell Wall Hydrolase [Caudoviricetes sp.]